MDLQDYLQEKRQQIDLTLDKLLPAEKGPEKVLYKAMRYSVFAGGKRLRPCLFLATLEALAQDSSRFLSFACALELIHTYSLIHDDLPAMDNDDFRRGKPTCHKAFDEAQAILAGDALLTYAFNCMIRVAPYTTAENLLAAIDEVASSAGIKGMIVGQVVDIACEGQPLTEEQLQFIHKHKTGALFKAAVVSAAILADADEKYTKILAAYAEKIGLVFQIADDILDVVGDQQKIGKPLGSDAKNKKTTYISLLGLAEARRLGQASAQEAQRLLEPLGDKAHILRQVPDCFLNRDR
ncbi:MAG: polyprenyl synthetase family protein [Bacillota bacterium]|jgi:geranylgeranyl diphosphate synthase type II